MQHNNDFVKLVEEYESMVKHTSIADVKQKLDNKDQFILVDVREDHEWLQGHIPQAIHLGRGIIERDIAKTIPDKNKEIVLYCGGGYRSTLAAYNLQKMGYAKVYSMQGGISAWCNNGYPLSNT